MSISSTSYSADYLYVLAPPNLLVYNILEILNPVLTQHVIDELFANYTRITVGNYIILSEYNSHRLAVYSKDPRYPQFIAEVYFQEVIMGVGAMEEFIIVVLGRGIKVMALADAELGIVEEVDFLSSDSIGRRYIQVTDVYVGKYLFVLEQELGLVMLKLAPLQVVKLWNVFGNVLAGYKDFVVVDGKYEINLVTDYVSVYNISAVCQRLGVDQKFIYCVEENKLIYVSRVANLTAESTFKPIHSFLVAKDVVFVSFREYIEVIMADLGPVTLEGSVPGSVAEYKVKFTVWGILEEEDSQSFVLTVQYSLTDVVLFILAALGGIFLVLVGGLFAFKHCRKDKVEMLPIVSSERRRVPSNSPVPTERNVFSERVLIQNSQTSEPS